MEVRNCKNCKRLFNYLQGPPICPACQDELEKKFQQVKDYVWDHRNATMEQIAEENEVTTKQIQQWVREERLTFSDDSPVGIPCENCGKLIKTGRFCPDCKNVIKDDFKSVTRQAPKPQIKKPTKDHDRMRFLDK